MGDPHLVFLISLVAALSVFLITLISTDAAMVFLILSMLLSPEIPLGTVPGRSVVIRFDDLLLMVVFVTWLAKLAVNKQLGVLRSTPMNVPLAAFILCSIASTGWGLINGNVENPTSSFFYFLKYLEYFVLFFMAANVIRDRRQVERFVKAMLFTAVIVTLYAYWQMAAYGTAFRVSAPFEGKPEPNTLAGYFIVMISLCFGLALYSASALQRLALLALVAFMLVPFMYTYSRGGYLAFMVMYLTFCLRSERYRPLLWGVLVLGLFLIPAVIPESVTERIAQTFDPRSNVQVGGMRLSTSPAYRVLAWKLVADKWFEHPLLGFGVTGLGFLVDNQHALVLGEVGILGFLVYLWVRWKLWAISARHFKTITDPLGKGLCLGFMACLAALVIQSFAGEIFIIVRIMEPFWFLAAIVVVLPTLMPKAEPAAALPLPGMLLG